MSEEDDIPTASECQVLVERFVEITKTDEALAQFFLQENEWHLERSLEQFLGSGDTAAQESDRKRASSREAVEGTPPKLQKLSNNTASASTKLSVPQLMQSSQLTDKPPSHFRFLTWNLDGIEPKNLKIRTKAAAKIIEKEGYDIVFLQEVTKETQTYLEKQLPQYLFISAELNDAPYYCVTLLKIFCIYYDSHKVISYDNTVMGRNLLQVDAHIGKTKLMLLNTHLESTAEFSNERIVQLKKAIQVATTNKSDDVNAVLAGDMNLRDKELVAAGGLPGRCVDAWIACGSKKEYQYTWDCLRNTNHQMPSKFQPRLRFDRVFVIPAESDEKIAIADFKLTGIQKISGTTAFPSDHWGVAVNFKLP